jgi:hypothetical protein
MRRWRVPLILSVVVLGAQLVHLPALHDVVTGRAPADARLAYPVLHVLLAPLTLLADWLNGGSRADLAGFGAWAVVMLVVLRLVAATRPRRWWRELLWALGSAAGLAAFVAWGALGRRPIPRLVTSDTTLLVLDVHSHTTYSHDGRRGFDAAANAAWHARAGFDAAFVTDHNTVGAAADGRRRATGAARLLPGTELSLAGLHMLVLGVDTVIPNRPHSASFQASLALLARLASEPTGTRPFVIASLPEYWRYHWGPEMASVVAAGMEGVEIWTSSPKAMAFPPGARRIAVGKARLHHLSLFGATDMHGLGWAATVWNLVPLRGWRAMTDSALTRELIAHFRAAGPDAVRVVAIRRWQPATPVGAAAAVPVNLALLLRTASRAHAAALLAWIWLVALLSLRSARRS